MAHANNMELLGVSSPNWNAGHSNVCVNGVHPDRLNGYPIPFIHMDCQTYCTQSLSGHTAGTIGYVTCDPASNKIEPSRDIITVAGVKRKWLDTYNSEGSNETHASDALVCSGVENCLPEVSCDQVKRLCLRESGYRDVDMEPTPSCYHDNLAFSSPPHDHTVTAHPPQDHTVTTHPPHNVSYPNSDSLMNHSHPRNKKQQFCTGILSEIGNCHHSEVLGTSVMECPRCLAGEPGHLDHILNQQHAMDTNC